MFGKINMIMVDFFHERCSKMYLFRCCFLKSFLGELPSDFLTRKKKRQLKSFFSLNKSLRLRFT